MPNPLNDGDCNECYKNAILNLKCSCLQAQYCLGDLYKL